MYHKKKQSNALHTKTEPIIKTKMKYYYKLKWGKNKVPPIWETKMQTTNSCDAKLGKFIIRIYNDALQTKTN